MLARLEASIELEDEVLAEHDRRVRLLDLRRRWRERREQAWIGLDDRDSTTSHHRSLFPAQVGPIAEDVEQASTEPRVAGAVNQRTGASLRTEPGEQEMCGPGTPALPVGY